VPIVGKTVACAQLAEMTGGFSSGYKTPGY